MSDEELIEELEDKLAEAERVRDINYRTMMDMSQRVRELEEQIEQLRQLLCAVASNTNKAQRIIAGEE